MPLYVPERQPKSSDEESKIAKAALECGDANCREPACGGEHEPKPECVSCDLADSFSGMKCTAHPGAVKKKPIVATSCCDDPNCDEAAKPFSGTASDILKAFGNPVPEQQPKASDEVTIAAKVRLECTDPSCVDPSCGTHAKAPVCSDPSCVDPLCGTHSGVEVSIGRKMCCKVEEDEIRDCVLRLDFAQVASVDRPGGKCFLRVKCEDVEKAVDALNAPEFRMEVRASAPYCKDPDCGTCSAASRAKQAGLELVFFYASWNKGSVKLSKMLGDLCEARGASYSLIDVDEDEDMAAHFSINSVPMLCARKQGKTLKTIAGDKECTAASVTSFVDDYCPSGAEEKKETVKTVELDVGRKMCCKVEEREIEDCVSRLGFCNSVRVDRPNQKCFVDLNVVGKEGKVVDALNAPEFRMKCTIAGSVEETGGESKEKAKVEEVASVRDVEAAEDPDAVVRTRIRVNNMCCEMESVLIKQKLEPMGGVESVTVNVVGRVAYVSHRPYVVDVDTIVKALNDVHLGASVASGGDDDETEPEDPDWQMITFGGLLFVLFVAGIAGSANQSQKGVALAVSIVLLVATGVGAVPIFNQAFKSLYRQRRLDVNCLMLMAVAGAIALGDYIEAAAVVVVSVAAEIIEGECLRRVRNALKDVINGDSDAKFATRPDGNRVPTKSLKLGDIVTARAGERVSVDGTVTKGTAAVDEAAVTGEPMPVAKSKGSAMLCGTMVTNGYVEIAVTSLPDESSSAALRRMVDEAQASSTRTQEIVTAFATWFTPAAIVAAVCVAVIPMLVDPKANEHVWIEKSLLLLVIACPCALILAAPIATVSAIGAAAKRGVLVKSASTLEALAFVNTLATDKTGTLTQGRCRVVSTAVAPGVDAAEAQTALELAAALETRSTHPLAMAIVNHAVGCVGEESVKLPEDIQDFRVIEGRGVSAIVDGADVDVGNEKMCGITKEDLWAEHVTGATTIFVAVDRKPILALHILDPLREEAPVALYKLTKVVPGIKIAMLTGDQPATANAILADIQAQLPERTHSVLGDKSKEPLKASVLDVDVRAGLRPPDKLAYVREAQEAGGVVLFVGDGINDAPALAAADVGAAMGAGGTAMAVEAADIAIMTDDLSRLPDAIQLGRFTTLLIKQNIFLSVVVKLVVIILAFTTDNVKLWMAVVADVGSLLLVIANGMRPLYFFTDVVVLPSDDVKGIEMI